MTHTTNDGVQSCDVLVVGGGPAGATVATILAERGWRVTVLEKDRYPRFHIGESLLPYSLRFFDELGVRDEIERIGLKKYGSEIISPYYGLSRTFRFSEVSDAKYTYAFQVRRSEFDDVLLRNCAAKGGVVLQGVKATRADFLASDKVLVTARDGSVDSRWETRFVVDASGRETFLSRQLGFRRRNPHHSSAAVFTHFTGVQRNCGKDEGNITLCWFDRGWFWLIPLRDGTTSVGAVCGSSHFKSRTASLDELFWDAVHDCAPVRERLMHAVQVRPTQAAANYSYSSKAISGDGFLIIGDASAFVDPVFSSGIHLALHSATLAAAAVDSYLSGRKDHEARVRVFQRQVSQGLSAFSWLIRHFNEPAFQYLLMHPRNWFGMKEAVLSIMAGDVHERRARFPLMLFRFLYYVTLVLTARRTLTARRLTRGNVEDIWLPSESSGPEGNTQDL